MPAWCRGAMIETQHLTKRHRSVTAVDDLSMTAPDGQVTGFVGPNGSGKTSTMRMMVGLDRPTSGTATIDQQHLRVHPAPQRAVGVVLDSGGAPDGMTARAHLRWLATRSEEHTSELQSRGHLVCRLPLETTTVITQARHP